MVRLVYNAGSSEAEDLPLIEQRLGQNKKVVVEVRGCQEEVHQTLEAMFGNGVIVDMKLHREDRITLAQDWHCSLHRMAIWGNQSREKARMENVDEPSSPEMIAGPTAREFAQSLGEKVSTLTIESSDCADMPLFVIDQCRELYRTALPSFEAFGLTKGFLGEKLLQACIDRHLPSELRGLELVQASDFSLSNPLWNVRKGLQDDNQVLFEYWGIHQAFEGYMEFDMLYQIKSSGQFVAFDATVMAHKSLHPAKQTAKLGVIERIIGSPIVLIHVEIGQREFRYQELSDNVFQWRLPCSVDLNTCLYELLPRTKGGRSTPSSAVR